MQPFASASHAPPSFKGWQPSQHVETPLQLQSAPRHTPDWHESGPRQRVAVVAGVPFFWGRVFHATIGVAARARADTHVAGVVFARAIRSRTRRAHARRAAVTHRAAVRIRIATSAFVQRLAAVAAGRNAAAAAVRAQAHARLARVRTRQGVARRRRRPLSFELGSLLQLYASLPVLVQTPTLQASSSLEQSGAAPAVHTPAVQLSPTVQPFASASQLPPSFKGWQPSQQVETPLQLQSAPRAHARLARVRTRQGVAVVAGVPFFRAWILITTVRVAARARADTHVAGVVFARAIRSRTRRAHARRAAVTPPCSRSHPHRNFRLRSKAGSRRSRSKRRCSCSPRPGTRPTGTSPDPSRRCRRRRRPLLSSLDPYYNCTRRCPCSCRHPRLQASSSLEQSGAAPAVHTPAEQ